MIRAILLVPADGDPHGLLAPGVCGAMPPILMPGSQTLRSRETAETPLEWVSADAMVRYSARAALVLVWDGEPVSEGCDRAIRCLIRSGYEPGYGIANVEAALNHAYSMDVAAYLGIAAVPTMAALCAARLGGEVVVLPTPTPAEPGGEKP